MKNINYNEIIYWNSLSYGNAVRIDKRKLKILLSVILFVLPFCNWAIPVVIKYIKSGFFLIRYDSLIDLLKIWRW